MKKLVLSLTAALVVGAGAMVLTTGGQGAKATDCNDTATNGRCVNEKGQIAWEKRCVPRQPGSIHGGVDTCAK